jgi:hypothetical protein
LPGISDQKKQDYTQQLDDLQKNIDILKMENDELHKKISVIFDYQKVHNKEDLKNKVAL